jgi:hypothetical protein
MRSFRQFLAAHPLLWVTPIVVVFGGLAWLASLVARAPVEPLARTLP